MPFPYKIYKTDGSIEVFELAFPMTLERLQKEVGGYIEMITFTDGRMGVVNEEGYIKDLPYNPHFTSYNTIQQPMGGFFRGNIVVGYVQ